MAAPVLPARMQIEFLRPLTACMLSERRAVRPFGILGGGSALAGINLLLRADGRRVNMGAKNVVMFGAGDRLRILTPGAPGLGAADCLCQMHVRAFAVSASLMGIGDRRPLETYRKCWLVTNHCQCSDRASVH